MLKDKENKIIESQGEFLTQITVEAPVIELFFNSANFTEIWPEDVANNTDFLKQTEARKKLSEQFNIISDRLPRPDMSLEMAIDQGHITERQVAEFYVALSNLLELSNDYDRIILYFPFELLPDKKWQSTDTDLTQASKQFSQAYLKAWKELLLMYDVRANFVDGDVLETENYSGQLPRIVKAAHLIPKLVEKGLLQMKEVLALIEESDDELLRSSLADTLPVLVDLGFLTEIEIKLMEDSDDRLLRNMARIIKVRPSNLKDSVEVKTEMVDLDVIQKKLTNEFEQIDNEDYGNITSKRKKWLTQKKKQEVVEKLGGNIGTAIIDGTFLDKQIKKYIASEANTLSQQVLIEGIRIAIESVASDNLEKAQVIYKQYETTLFALWDSDNQLLKEMIAKVFRRLNRLKIVTDRQLAELNINIPKLAGPFSENLQKMKGEIENIKRVIQTIETSPELSHLLYPVALIYGSRLKGYGKQNADIDVGVFVRPEVIVTDLPKLKQLLKEIFVNEDSQDEVVQFWLEEKQGQLSVRDFDQADKSLGESYWTHVLFGAVWEGDKNVISELRKSLLSPYLYDKHEKIKGMEARTLYLTEMERDVLQYRLMHNGYERFFPSYGGIHTAHADEIDGESIFWDSGYRQLATKLFLSKVFLPSITTPEK